MKAHSGLVTEPKAPTRTGYDFGGWYKESTAWNFATDMVTTPVTFKGRIIFGIGCGLLTVVIRLWGGYPEGVSYSILLMNLTTPLLDRYTRPKVFGG